MLAQKKNRLDENGPELFLSTLQISSHFATVVIVGDSKPAIAAQWGIIRGREAAICQWRTH